MPDRRSRGGGGLTRLVLLGGGHAHLATLARLGTAAGHGIRATLIAPGTLWYSGAATGVLGGSLPRAAARIEVGALARRAGVAHVEGEDWSREGDAIRVSGRLIPFDRMSVALGSVTHPLPGPGRQMGVKPLGPLLALGDQVAAGRLRHLVVVGAGVTGCEVALALAARARRAGRAVAVTLAGRAALPGSGLPPGARRLLARHLELSGITVRLGQSVTAVTARGAALADGGVLAAELVVVATGLHPNPALARLGVALDGRGAIAVGPALRARADRALFGGGDAISPPGPTLPPLGVFAVREGAVLARNLLAPEGARPVEFRPQRRWLQILDLGDGTGLAARGGWWGRGAWALAWKRGLDRQFVARWGARSVEQAEGPLAADIDAEIAERVAVLEAGDEVEDAVAGAAGQGDDERGTGRQGRGG